MDLSDELSTVRENDVRGCGDGRDVDDILQETDNISESGDSDDSDDISVVNHKVAANVFQTEDVLSIIGKNSFQAMLTLVLDKEAHIISLPNEMCCMKPPVRIFARRVEVPLACVNSFKRNRNAKDCMAIFQVK